MTNLLFESQDWFAWRPVRLVTGRWAWWRWVRATRAFGTWRADPPPWEYREIAAPESV
jgi:hypothetical protein